MIIWYLEKCNWFKNHKDNQEAKIKKASKDSDDKFAENDDASEDFENSRTVNKNQKDKDKVENLQSDSKLSNDANTANISKQINDQKEKSAGRKKGRKSQMILLMNFLKIALQRN